MSAVQVLLIAVLFLVGSGLYGLLVARHLIRLLIALQVLMKGVVLALVVAGSQSGQPALGESAALTVIAADTLVAVVGIALAIRLQRTFGTLDTKELSTLKG